jgi:NADH:ubiquinone oxidoreductase subunit K
MPIEFYLVLSAALVGIGIGAALSRRNLIAIVMALTTSGLGALVAMAALNQYNGNQGDGSKDGMLFAFCIGAILLVQIVLGCVLTYRRYIASGATNVDDGNELRY